MDEIKNIEPNMTQPPNTVPEPAPVLIIPQHEKHTERDSADDILDARAKKAKLEDGEREARQMPGFVQVHTCANCGKRLKPRTVEGRVSYGKCPHCETEMFPNSESFYAGKTNTHVTNRYAKPDAQAFKDGAVTDDDLRVNVRKLPPLKQIV